MINVAAIFIVSSPCKTKGTSSHRGTEHVIYKTRSRRIGKRWSGAMESWRRERERMEREKESHIQSRAKRMSFVGVQTAPVLHSRAVWITPSLLQTLPPSPRILSQCFLLYLSRVTGSFSPLLLRSLPYCRLNSILERSFILLIFQGRRRSTPAQGRWRS